MPLWQYSFISSRPRLTFQYVIIFGEEQLRQPTRTNIGGDNRGGYFKAGWGQVCSWGPAHLLSQLAPPQVLFFFTFFSGPMSGVFLTPHRSKCLMNHSVGIVEIIIILFQCSCVQLCPSCRLPHQVGIFHPHSDLCKKTPSPPSLIFAKTSSSSSLSSTGCLPRITMMFADSPTQKSQL